MSKYTTLDLKDHWFLQQVSFTFYSIFSVCTVLVCTYKKSLLSYIVSVTGSSPVPTPGINGSAKHGLQEGEKKRKRKTLDVVEVQPKGTCKNL